MRYPEQSLKVVDKLIKYYESNPKRWIKGEAKKINKNAHMLGCCIMGGFDHFSYGNGIDGFKVSYDLLDLGDRLISRPNKPMSLVDWNDNKCKDADQAIALLKKMKRVIEKEIKSVAVVKGS